MLIRYESQVSSIDSDIINIYDNDNGHKIAYIQRYSTLPTELTLCPRHWEAEATVNLIEFFKCLQAIDIKAID